MQQKSEAELNKMSVKQMVPTTADKLDKAKKEIAKMEEHEISELLSEADAPVLKDVVKRAKNISVPSLQVNENTVEDNGGQYSNCEKR